MKIRNLLVAFVLAMMVLFAGSFRVNTAQAQPNCGCQEYLDSCRLACNPADPEYQFCLDSCTPWYNCCMNICNNVGHCD